MERDTLYYYKIEGDKIGKINKVIEMNKCLEIFEKDMSSSKEKGFTFRINIGERIYHLMAMSESERINWVNALRVSMKTARELERAGVQ